MTAENRGHWLQLQLIGTKSNRDGVGARVEVTASDLVQYEQQKGGMSYQAAHDPRLHFGLGEKARSTGLRFAGRVARWTRSGT